MFTSAAERGALEGGETDLQYVEQRADRLLGAGKLLERFAIDGFGVLQPAHPLQRHTGIRVALDQLREPFTEEREPDEALSVVLLLAGHRRRVKQAL